jgi:hypothetical protein
METIQANHERAGSGEAGGVGCVCGNECLEDLEEVAATAGLHFVVNGVVNSERELAGIFAGAPKPTHSQAIQMAERICATKLPPPADIAVLNAYPKDLELMVDNTLNATGYDLSRVLKPGGTVVMTTACSHGLGSHFYFGPNGRAFHRKTTEGDFGGFDLILFSPNLSIQEVRQTHPKGTLVFDQWAGVVEELQRRHGDRASASVFPCASIQMPEG